MNSPETKALDSGFGPQCPISEHGPAFSHSTRQTGDLFTERQGDDLLDLRLRWQELLWRDIQGLCEAKQFEVSHAPDLGFNLGDHIFGDIPAKHPAPGSQHSLGKPQLMAKGLNAGTKDVLLLRHLPNLEVDRSDIFDSIASVFGRFLGVLSESPQYPQAEISEKWPLEMRFIPEPQKVMETSILGTRKALGR